MIKPSHSLPKTLITALMGHTVLLWIGVAFNIQILAVFHFTLLFLALGIIVTSLVAAISYFLRKMTDYWVTYYPILLVITLLGYGAIKLPIQLSGIIIASSGLIVGYGISCKLNGVPLRLMPTIAILPPLLFGELSVSREIKVTIVASCAGLLIRQIVKHRAQRGPFFGDTNVTHSS